MASHHSIITSCAQQQEQPPIAWHSGGQHHSMARIDGSKRSLGCPRDACDRHWLPLRSVLLRSLVERGLSAPAATRMLRRRRRARLTMLLSRAARRLCRSVVAPRTLIDTKFAP